MTENDCFKLRENGVLFRCPPGLHRCRTKPQRDSRTKEWRNMERMRVRTDLALEAKESFEGSDVEVHGVVVEENYDEEKDIRLTRVQIVSERGAREMGKPVGNYLTLEAPGMASPDEDYHREISEALAHYLKELMGEEKER